MGAKVGREEVMAVETQTVGQLSKPAGELGHRGCKALRRSEWEKSCYKQSYRVP